MAGYRAVFSEAVPIARVLAAYWVADAVGLLLLLCNCRCGVTRVVAALLLVGYCRVIQRLSLLLGYWLVTGVVVQGLFPWLGRWQALRVVT